MRQRQREDPHPLRSQAAASGSPQHARSHSLGRDPPGVGLPQKRKEINK